MKKVNNLRAQWIYNEYGPGDSSIVVTDVLKKFLSSCPSIIETGKCNQKGCLSKEHKFAVPVVSISDEVFNDNMANLKSAILANFPSENSCKKCRKPLAEFQRVFGCHLFIEVSTTK